jgi:hypothetical protein
MLKTLEKTAATISTNDLEALLLAGTLNQRQIMTKMRNLAMDPMAQMRMMNMPRFDMGALSAELSKGLNQMGCFSPDTQTPSTDLSVISTSVRTKDVQRVKWTDLNDLPAMWINSIRALAQDIFPAFGLKAQTSVRVICAFSDNDFLNSTLEVNAVVGFLEANLGKASQGNLCLDFSEFIEGYAPEARVYYSEKHTYLVLNEPEGMGFEGNYVYCFERESLGVLGHKKQIKKSHAIRD